MLRKCSGLFLLMLVYFSAAVAKDDTLRQEAVQFHDGRVSIKARLKGAETIDYTFGAKVGQRLSVSIVPRNPSTYFNVLPPGTDETIFTGSTSGNRFDDTLARDGEYKVRVYLMRSAARRNEKTDFSLSISLSASSDGVASTGFNRTLELHGILFQVSSANSGSVNQLKITPSGLSIDNTPISRTIDGTVIGAEIADLNVDGSPEVYVYVQSAGSGSYGSVVAFSANNRKSLSEIVMPDLMADLKNSRGYQGHDEFAVVENILARRFPIFRNVDQNARPSGKLRQLQYKLVKGQANWRLRLDRVSEF